MGMQISCGDRSKVPKDAGPHPSVVQYPTEVQHSDGDGIPERKVSHPHTPSVTRGQARFHRETQSRGYCVSTIGMDEETIRAYVRNQEELEKQEELDFNKDDSPF
jgi:hypothetical protein